MDALGVAACRRALLAVRAALMQDATCLAAQAVNRWEGEPPGPGSAGSEDLDHDLELGAVEACPVRLADIDAALARIDAGTFGVCEACARPLSPPRSSLWDCCGETSKLGGGSQLGGGRINIPLSQSNIQDRISTDTYNDQ